MLSRPGSSLGLGLGQGTGTRTVIGRTVVALEPETASASSSPPGAAVSYAGVGETEGGRADDDGAWETEPGAKLHAGSVGETVDFRVDGGRASGGSD